MIRYQGKEYTSNTHSVTAMNSYEPTPVNILKQIFNLHNQKEINEISDKVAKYGVLILCESSRVNYCLKLITCLTRVFILVLLTLQVLLYLLLRFSFSRWAQEPLVTM